MSGPVFPQKGFIDHEANAFMVPVNRPSHPFIYRSDHWGKARRVFYSIPTGTRNDNARFEIPLDPMTSNEFLDQLRVFDTSVIYDLAARATTRKAAALLADMNNTNNSSSSPGPLTPTHSPISMDDVPEPNTRNSSCVAEPPSPPTNSMDGISNANDEPFSSALPLYTQSPRNFDLLLGSVPDVEQSQYGFRAPGSYFPGCERFSTKRVLAPQLPEALTNNNSRAPSMNSNSTRNPEPISGYNAWFVDSYVGESSRRNLCFPPHNLSKVTEEQDAEEE